MAFETTPAHKAIFDAVDAGDRNIIISAVAGSGKTTTIVEALKRIPTNKKVLFLAFNKKIAEELQKRVPSHVSAMTLNALGHRAYCGSRKPAPVRVDADKLRGIAKVLLTNNEMWAFGSTVVKLCRLAKAAGVVPDGVPGAVKGLLPDTVDTWMGLIDHFDLDIPENTSDVVVVDNARRVLRESLRTMDTIDFDDQLLMTFAYNMPIPQYDWVFVDESQDLSPLQHELVARALNENGRMVAVGDERQSIYAFRGADSSSMANLQQRFNCVSLPLHVSYRCPKAVVAVAQQYVNHIKAHDSAPAGMVDDSRMNIKDVKDFKGGDFVVCRTNAPLVQAAHYMLRSRIPCVILGREIGQGLLSLIKKLKATDLPTLLHRLETWESKESANLLLMGKEDKAAAIHDKADTIRVFAESVENVPELERSIERMFDDKSTKDVVTLATIHKAKGLEADRVFIINFDDMPCRWAKKPWQQQQELNLVYVAVTRAKVSLHMVVVPRDSKTT